MPKPELDFSGTILWESSTKRMQIRQSGQLEMTVFCPITGETHECHPYNLEAGIAIAERWEKELANKRRI